MFLMSGRHTDAHGHCVDMVAVVVGRPVCGVFHPALCLTVYILVVCQVQRLFQLTDATS